MSKFDRKVSVCSPSISLLHHHHRRHEDSFIDFRCMSECFGGREAKERQHECSDVPAPLLLRKLLCYDKNVSNLHLSKPTFPFVFRLFFSHSFLLFCLIPSAFVCAAYLVSILLSFNMNRTETCTSLQEGRSRSFGIERLIHFSCIYMFIWLELLTLTSSFASQWSENWHLMKSNRENFQNVLRCIEQLERSTEAEFNEENWNLWKYLKQFSSRIDESRAHILCKSHWTLISLCTY